MCNDCVLKRIDNGVVDFYFGLKFQTNLPYEKLVIAIRQKANSIFARYYDNTVFSLQEDLKETVKRRGFGKSVKIKTTSKGRTKVTKAITRNTIDGLNVELTDKGLKIQPITKIENHIQKTCARSESAYAHDEEIYGGFYVNSQNRIILPPLMVTLNNSKSVFVESILYIFKNKSAVLRLTLPLNDTNPQSLMENDFDAYISDIVDVCETGISLKDVTIESLKKFYFDFILKNNKKIKKIIYTGKIVSIILSKHSVTIKDVKKIPIPLQKDIYRILFSPLPNWENEDYSTDAKKCFTNLSHTLNGICSIFNNIHKCVTIIDDSILSRGQKLYEEAVYDRVIDDVRNGIEFAFCIIMLKKISDQYTFYIKEVDESKETEVQTAYYNDKIFISLLLDNAYGSVREQVAVFERNMKYFIDAQNASDRLNAINNILDQKKSTRIQKLENTLSLGGLAFTTLFGLPAITDTVFLLRGICSFIETDVPVLTIENFSFSIWLFAICIIVCAIFNKKGQ